MQNLQETPCSTKSHLNSQRKSVVHQRSRTLYTPSPVRATPKSRRHAMKRSILDNLIEQAKDPEVKCILRPFNVTQSDSSNIESMGRQTGDYLKKTARFLDAFSKKSGYGSDGRTSIPTRRCHLASFIVEQINVFLNLAPGGTSKKTNIVSPSLL